MLDLNSALWNQIPAAGGMTGTLTAKLLRDVRAGDRSAYAELFEQVCHQFTFGAVAYVAVPHLVDIARSSSLALRVEPLRIIGAVEASRFANGPGIPPLLEIWRAEYLAANEEARKLTADALGYQIWTPTDSQELLATLAALHGHGNLALHLFLHGGNTDLSCPSCGELIEFRESDS